MTFCFEKVIRGAESVVEALDTHVNIKITQNKKIFECPDYLASSIVCSLSSIAEELFTYMFSTFTHSIHVLITLLLS